MIPDNMSDYLSGSSLKASVCKSLHAKLQTVPLSSLLSIPNPEMYVVESVEHSDIRLVLDGSLLFRLASRS